MNMETDRKLCLRWSWHLIGKCKISHFTPAGVFPFSRDSQKYVRSDATWMFQSDLRLTSLNYLLGKQKISERNIDTSSTIKLFSFHTCTNSFIFLISTNVTQCSSTRFAGSMNCTVGKYINLSGVRLSWQHDQLFHIKKHFTSDSDHTIEIHFT